MTGSAEARGTAAAGGAVRLASAAVAGWFAVAPGAGASEAGDPGRGAELWGRCAECHMVGADARHDVGPHLNDLFGRPAASLADFGYSDEIRRAGADGLVWTAEQLDRYLTDPRALVAGTRMSFRGLSEARDRRDLLAFLRGFSAGPDGTLARAPAAAPRDPELAPEVLAIEGDRDYGAYLASECVTCHQASGADEGIPSITGWSKERFVTALHAYRAKARPHPAMQMIAGRLSDEEIASLAVYFSGAE